ncbi:MAG: DUF805 domain-containing protein [Pseudomonadota bacterium]
MRRYLSGRGSRGSLWVAVIALIAFNLTQTPQVNEIGPRVHALLIGAECFGIADPEPAACTATSAVNGAVRMVIHGGVQLIAAGQPLLNYGLVQARLAPHAPEIMMAAKDPDYPLDWSALLPILVHLVGVYWIFVASMRRCHDRGMSAWWLLITVVPVVGFIWWARELGFKAGDAQDNRFGAPAHFRLPFQRVVTDLFAGSARGETESAQVRA